MSVQQHLQDMIATLVLGFFVVAVFLAGCIAVTALLRGFRTVLRGWWM